MTNNPHIAVARRVLTELAGMAEHASMTGSLKGGQRAAAVAFNGALATIRAHDAIPDGMFEPLDPDAADYGSLGVQSRLLLAILQEEPEPRRGRRERDEDERGGLGAVVALAPFLDSEDLAQMVRERIDEAAEVSDGLLTALAPFLDSHDLGDLVRRRVRPRAPQPPTPPVQPTPVAPEATIATPPDLRPVVAPSVTLEGLAAELRRPDLTAEERQRIATRLAELAYEQSIGG